MEDKKFVTGIDKIDEIIKGGINKNDICFPPSFYANHSLGKSNFLFNLAIKNGIKDEKI